jgi:hypothetical protein
MVMKLNNRSVLIGKGQKMSKGKRKSEELRRKEKIN